MSDRFKTFVPITQLTSDVRGLKSEVRPPIFVSDIFAHTELQAAPVFDAANERTRPNLKVQDGCDKPMFILRYSLCPRTEPLIAARPGHSRSRNPRRRWLSRGSDFRHQPGQMGKGLKLSALSYQLSVKPAKDQRLTDSDRLSKTLYGPSCPTRRLEKLRISSVEPMDWSDELVRMMAESPRIAKHAHVPLQSGSDAVLRRMHRKYRPWHYREKIEKIHAAMPAAAIGADVMVGFPGESEAEFEERAPWWQIFRSPTCKRFTYSARPGTPAASMGKQVPAREARERSRILRDLIAEKKLTFMTGFIAGRLTSLP